MRALLRFALLLLILTLAIPLNPASALAQDTPPGDQNPFLTLFPELAQMAAPAWLREGTRLTYSSRSAIVGADPEFPHPAGPGYIQHDLVALDRRNAVWATTILGILDDGSPVPNVLYGWTSVPSTTDFYVNPAVLTRAEEVANPDLAVARMPYTIGETTYDAVRFQSETVGGEFVWMFDEASGILLFHRYAVEGAGGVNSGDMTLANARRIRLPWRSTAAPAWADRGVTLDFAGRYTPVILGDASTSLNQALSIEITRAQPRWTLQTATASTAGILSGSITQSSGVAQLFGALWLPEEALTARPRRPVIDVDPVTGLQVAYERQGGSITLTQSGGQYVGALTYDATTGALVALHSEVPIGVGVNVTDFWLSD